MWGRMPVLAGQAPKQRTRYGTGIDARKANEYRARMDPAAEELLQECQKDPHESWLVEVQNLNALRKLVEERTKIKCKRCQYRSQAGLVEYLMQWFHNKQALLEAVALAITCGELPPNFGRAPSPDIFAVNFGPDDDFDQGYSFANFCDL